MQGQACVFLSYRIVLECSTPLGKGVELPALAIARNRYSEKASCRAKLDPAEVWAGMLEVCEHVVRRHSFSSSPIYGYSMFRPLWRVTFPWGCAVACCICVMHHLHARLGRRYRN